MQQDLCVLGIISGSSLDGLDMALCHFTNGPPDVQWTLIDAQTALFPDVLFDKLKRGSQLAPRELFALDAQFASFCAREIQEFANHQSRKPDYVASHGHTIFHDPARGYSLQIGNGGIIAAQSGYPCISDFRNSDVALGGQGAPLAPIVEKWIFDGYDYYLNLGGIANLSFHRPEQILSYDVVPCNQILNHLAGKRGLPYDDRGHMARQGQLIPGLANTWESLPYFHKPYPKSMDNDWVTRHFLGTLDDSMNDVIDMLHTAVKFIVRQIFADIKQLHKAQKSEGAKLLVTGGGGHNAYLIDLLAEELSTLGIELDIPQSQVVDYKEAVLMALMGYLRINSMTNTLRSVTGASRDCIGGGLYIP